MKKTLSIFLALVMAFNCGLCAFAADPSVLHTATGIEAVWNGEIMMNYNTYIPGEKVEPGFGYGNVAVTLTYADQEPKTLGEWEWYGYWNNDWRYDVCYAITGRTDTELTVTFYYSDTNLENAYRESGGELDWEVLKQLVWFDRYVPELADYAATLPQTTIKVPANMMQL